MQEKEIWKELIGYEGKYWISTLGRIKSNYLGGMFLKPCHHRDGYLKVGLSDGKYHKPFLLHRLVAIHFIPNPLNLREINHIDGNKENNCVDNLEWCTRKHNIQHAEKMGLMYHPAGELNAQSKSFFQFDLQGNLLKYWKCLNTCAKYLFEHDERAKKEFSNVRSLSANLSHTLTGKHKSCCGYLFSFYPEVDLKEHEWIKHYKPVMAIDKKTGEEFTFDYIQSLEDYIMPNGQRTQATMIVKACKGKRKSHAGYFWKYLENNKK